MKKKGFTLVELVMSIVLFGIMAYPAINILITANIRGQNLDALLAAGSLAEGKLEEVMAKSFANITNTAAASYSGDLSGYSAQVEVDNVEKTDLNTPVVAVTDYKKITVKIYNQRVGTVEVSSIRSNI